MSANAAKDLNFKFKTCSMKSVQMVPVVPSRNCKFDVYREVLAELAVMFVV